MNRLANNPNGGFAWAVRATGFLVLGCLVIANLLIRTRLPTKKDGKILDVKVFTDGTYVVFILGSFFIMLGVVYPLFYLQTCAFAKGTDSNLAFYFLAILNAAPVFGRAIPNYMADKIGPLNVMIPACVATGVVTFTMVAVDVKAGLVVFALVFGFVSGAFVAILPAAIASLCADMSTIGNRIGTAYAIVSIAALGPPIAGAIITAQGGKYWGAGLFSGLCCIIGSIIILIHRRWESQRKGTWRV